MQNMSQNVYVDDLYLQRSAENLSWLMVAVSSVSNAVTLYFILMLELPQKRTLKPDTSILSVIFSPVNRLLITFTLNNTIMYTCQSISYKRVLENMINDVGEPVHQAPIFVAVSGVCQAVAEMAYLFYGWTRSKCVIERHFPNFYTTIHTLMHASPLIYVVQCLPDIIRTFSLDTISEASLIISQYSLTAVCALFACLMDTLFLFTFVSHLRSSGFKSDSSFSIISSNGTAACILAYISAVLYFASLFFGTRPMHNLLYAVSDAVFQVIYTFMFLMKIGLCRTKKGDNGTDQAMNVVRQAVKQSAADLETQQSAGRNSSFRPIGSPASTVK